MKRFVVGLVGLVFAIPSDAVQADAGQIRWKGGVQRLQLKDPAAIRADLDALAPALTQRHVVVRFSQPVAKDLRARLEANGLRLLDYLGDNAYVAALQPHAVKAQTLSGEQSLTWVSNIEPERKLHPDLLAGTVHPWAIPIKEAEALRAETQFTEPADLEQAAKARNVNVGVYIKFHADVNVRPDGIALCQQYGALIRGQLKTINGLVIELPYANIRLLAAEDAVEWIEPPLPAMSEVNSGNRARTGADIVQAAPYGLNGAGVQVLVYDGGRVRTTHVDFQGRAIIGSSELACTAVSDHATHVAGTIGGAGVAVAANKGMAPAVDIISNGLNQGGGCSLSQGFLYNDPCDLEIDYGNAINTHGADIANNSIGTNTAPNGFPCSWEGDYAVTDMVIDQVVRGSVSAGGTPFRIVWANGNERGSGACGTTYHTTAPPACAKNHITVGAMNSNDDSVTSFTSWGPTDDDRMKPDISAPGCQVGGDAGVTSCGSASDTSYTSKCGTSMASPTVCGLAALLLQDYRAQFPATPDPRNSTLKILFAHTAVDLVNPGPDYQTGYGSVRIQPAIDFMRTGNFLENQVSHSEVFSLLAVVSPTDTELKVTLAWDDPPGTPLVSPALVNDLDLVVYDSNNVQLFPWTLGGNANPSAAAVRTQRNSVDNIEQVYLSAPQPGVYRVEVHGFIVPQGPQVFSLCASPQLVKCSSQGTISLDRLRYSCSSTAVVRVNDCDLNTDDGVVETVDVNVGSHSEPAGEVLTLTETGPETALFAASIPLSTTNAPGVLLVADGNNIRARYLDLDDGQGNNGVPVSDTAPIDCVPPVISNVQTVSIGARNATVTFTTDESARGTVRWGTSCGSLTNSVQEGGFGTSHSIVISGLDPNSTYFYAVDAIDSAGNSSSDDNGGACYTFATPNIPELFTEIFEASDNDLDNKMIMFTPDAGISKYKTCTFNIASLPTDPTGGTTITTWTGTADDGNSLVTLTGGQTVKLYETSFGSVFVGTNGYITFTAGDTDYTETLADHFAVKRVAALFDDLNPGTGGTVSYKQLADRLAVTWLNVFEFSTTNPNTCQIELYFDGRIVISYLSVSITDGLAGLSNGGGLSPDFFESDLSNQASGCGPLPPSAANGAVSVDTDTNIDITLVASDPNGDPMVFTIMSLPANGTLNDPGAGLITSTPYTLVGGGNVVRYRSTCGYVGPDQFTFKVTANGDDSNVATVSITVLPLFVNMFTETFPTTVFNPANWVTVSNATIDTVGIAEPSEPNSARFNGTPSGADSIVSRVFDFSAESAVQLSYAYEQRGGGESPDAADDLFIEFFNSSSAWQLVNQHLGSGPDMTTYATVTVTLPASALHANFQLRIRNTATTGAFDDWFVDDVRLFKPLIDLCVCFSLTAGDLNQDTLVNGDDISDFTRVVLNPGGATAAERCMSDANNDEIVDYNDVEPFVELLVGP